MERFQVGDWLVEPKLNRIHCGDEKRHLEPRTMDLLVYFTAHAGEVLSKERLIESVWKGACVSDGAFTYAISQLRHALDDTARDPEYIQTFHRRGYRLRAPVTRLKDASRERGIRSFRRPIGYAVSVVVLLLTIFSIGWWTARVDRSSRLMRVVPLVTEEGFENWPALSPDGNYVAFQGSAEDDQAEIFVKQVGQESSLRRTHASGIDHAPSWSPDGKWIVFLRGQGSADGPLQVLLMSPLTGEEKQIGVIDAAVRWAYRPAWTADSRSVVVPDRADPQAPYVLYRISIEDGRRTQLTDSTGSPDGAGDQNPAVSPDGDKLAFTRDGDVHVVALDGNFSPKGKPLRLAELTGSLEFVFGLAWTGDSREVVFAAGQWPLGVRMFRVAASGGKVRPIPELSVGTFAPSINLLGDKLAFSQWIADSDIWELEVDGVGHVLGEASAVISSSHLDLAPSHSRDGKWVAFSSNRSGVWSVWVARPDGSDERCLAAADYTVAHPFGWSPDGTQIASVNAGGIQISGIETAEQYAVTNEPGRKEDVVWAPNGWIYFSCFRNHAWQVCRVPAAGGTLEQVTEGGGKLLDVSPDGSQLYFAEGEKVWKMTLDTMESEPALDFVPYILDAAETGLYFARFDEPEASDQGAIYYREFGSPVDTPVMRVHSVLGITGLSVSPDGSRLLYGSLNTHRMDLMLVENFH